MAKPAWKDEIPKGQWKASRSTKSKLRCIFVLVMVTFTSVLVLNALLPEHIKDESTPHGRIALANVVPHSFMIDVITSDDEDTRASAISLENTRKSVLTELDDAGIVYEITRTISSPIFNGFRISSRNHDVVLNLKKSSNVVDVWPVRIYSGARLNRFGRQNLQSPPAPGVSNTESFPFSSPGFPFYPPHSLTGVDKLHAQGLNGSGVRIGIIDSGIDYTHPALGNCFRTPGCPIAGGTDLVGDNFNTSVSPVPDHDPMDTCNGHGTAVAGFIMANATNANASQPFVGVAPGVTVNMYRVFSCQSDSTTEDVITQALALAFADGVDIISMSLAGPNGWSEDPHIVIADRLASKGVIIVAAAGNDGVDGLFYSSHPGAGQNVISVGSVDNTAYFGWPSLAAQNRTIYYFSTNPSPPIGPLPIYITANSDGDREVDACNPLPPGTPDLSQFLVLTSTGACNFDDKIKNLLGAGAKNVLTNTKFIIPTFNDVRLFSAFISFEDGQFLRSNANTTITFPATPPPQLFPNTVSPGLMSRYSSWGPTNELNVYPNVAAPGGSIYSTLPLQLGGYTMISGTSFSTPYVTGLIALYLSAHGRKDPSEIKNLLISTASPVDWNNGSATFAGMKAPVVQQGGGLINATQFLKTTTLINPPFIELNQTANFKGTQTITITNLGDNNIVYQVGSINAGTVFTLNDTGSVASYPPNVTNTNMVSVSFFPQILELSPGTSRNLTATFSLLPGIDESHIPVYSGYVTLSSFGGPDNEILRIPYVGVAANLTSFDPLGRLAPWPALTVHEPTPEKPIPDIVNGTGVFTMVENDQPAVTFQLFLPSRAIRGLVLPPTDAPTPGTTTILGVNAFGVAAGTRLDGGLARNILPEDSGTYTMAWNGEFENGTKAVNGDYRLALFVLKMFASDENNPDSWNSFTTPVFKVAAAGA